MNYPPMRTWQREARAVFFEKEEPRDFLAAATPGSGKTLFALMLAKEQIDNGSVERVAVVVPTDALRQQWADEAHAVGLNLTPVVEPEDYEKQGYHGCVATYAQLARGAGSDLMRRALRHRTFAIVDEIHHAGRNASWGEGLVYALENATHRLALTGTPWRSDPQQPIPFVQYDDQGRVVVDYAYEYGNAVADGVCRRCEFHAYNGEVRWVDCGNIKEAIVGEDVLRGDDIGIVLSTLYDPRGSWMPSLLRQAHADLVNLRSEIPDAGGLVIAERQDLARAYAVMLDRISGHPVTLVISDDPDAKAAIDRFRESGGEWLVAVRMVSEGVDIPRLGVGVFAAKVYKSPLFFRQVVGRLVRVRPREEFNARLYIPAVPTLMQYAHEIEEELRHELDLAIEADEKARGNQEGQEQVLELRMPLSSSEAEFGSAILGHQSYDSAERAEAEAACQKYGIPTTYWHGMADYRRDVGPVVNQVTVRPATLKPEVPRHRHEKALRSEVEKLARKIAYRKGVEVREVNTRLLQAGFPARKNATIEQLEQMRTVLAGWLDERR